MTALTKPVARRTTILLDNRQMARSRDLVTVTMYPDLTIGFRRHGSRKEARLDLAVVYRLALTHQAEEDNRQKRIERQAQSGRRVRRVLPTRGLLTT